MATSLGSCRHSLQQHPPTSLGRNRGSGPAPISPELDARPARAPGRPEHDDGLTRAPSSPEPNDRSTPQSASTARRLDDAVQRIRAELLALSIPLIAAASIFIRCRAWKQFGYARLGDHARERLDRSAGWVRNLAELGDAVARLPGLIAALSGEDGQRPLGLEAARHLAKVATVESLDGWLAMARREPLQVVKQRVAMMLESTRQAQASQATNDDRGHDTAQDKPQLADLAKSAHQQCFQRLSLPVPAVVHEAFSEAHDLYQAVEGRRLSTGEFVESLIAETRSSIPALTPVDQAHGDEAHSDEDTGAPPVLRSGIAGLDASGRPVASCASPACVDGPEDAVGMSGPESTPAADPAPDPIAAEAAMRRIISEQERLRARLAEAVSEISDRAAWRALGYLSLASYADARLDWSRSTLYGRLDMVRRLRRLPLVGEAYREGRIGLSATQAIVRLLTQGPAAQGPAHEVVPLHIPPQVQSAWVERASTATVKRLEDEIRAVTRRRVFEQAVQQAESLRATRGEMYEQTRGEYESGSTSPPGHPLPYPDHPLPLDDGEWHESLERTTGTARRRVRALAMVAASRPGPLQRLHLVLPAATAQAFRRLLEDVRRRPQVVQMFGLASSGPESAGPDAAGPGSVGPCAAGPCAAGSESAGPESAGLESVGPERAGPESREVPVWGALMAVLLDFVSTWDVEIRGRKPSEQRIYVRDGWRCMAPGCSSRRNLEVHHVVYRSRGGKNDPENLVCLCRFHHQMGEHGLLARVRGKAPLGMAWWLGRNGCGGSFRNERRVAG